MIHVAFDPDKLRDANERTWWMAWQLKADKATQAIVKQWNERSKTPQLDECGKEMKHVLKFDRHIWTECKNWTFKNLFHGKCAFCEAKLTNFSPHGEHWRPKAGVTFKKDEVGEAQKVEIRDEHGRTIHHPGYFHLAYNWANLLPSCQFCNCHPAKQNQFPVERDHVFCSLRPAGEDASPALGDSHYLPDFNTLNALEKPKLLHPYLDDPKEHLVFGIDGSVNSATDKGGDSISVFDLDREELRKSRREAQDAAWNAYLLDMMQNNIPVNPNAATPFSESVRAALKSRTKGILGSLIQLHHVDDASSSPNTTDGA